MPTAEIQKICGEHMSKTVWSQLKFCGHNTVESRKQNSLHKKTPHYAGHCRVRTAKSLDSAEIWQRVQSSDSAEIWQRRVRTVQSSDSKEIRQRRVRTEQSSDSTEIGQRRDPTVQSSDRAEFGQHKEQTAQRSDSAEFGQCNPSKHVRSVVSGMYKYSRKQETNHRL